RGDRGDRGDSSDRGRTGCGNESNGGDSGRSRLRPAAVVAEVEGGSGVTGRGIGPTPGLNGTIGRAVWRFRCGVRRLMASKSNQGETHADESGDAPLLDLNEASVKKLIARAKKRGYITYDELNSALPQDQMSSEQIEDVMSALNDMGVNIVENEEHGEDGEEKEENEVEAIDTG